MDAGEHAVPRGRGFERTAFAVAAALALAAAWIAATTVQRVVALHHPLPFWDQWDSLTDVQLAGRGEYDLQLLCRQHNEHRIPFARLLFLADHRWFGGAGVFLLAFMLLTQLAHGSLLLLVTNRRPRLPAWAVVAGGAVLLAALFSSTQIENLMWGFQVQFVLVYFAATAAVVGLAGAVRAASPRRRAAWLAAMVASGVVCTYSMANGVLVWPVLVAAAWALRARPGVWLTVVASGAACLFAFFDGYQATAGGSASPVPAGEVLRRSPEVAKYLASFLGNPVAGQGIDATVAAGAALLVAGAAMTAFVLLRRELRTAPNVVLVHVMAFAAGSGLITAVGRGLTLGYVTASRYATAALCGWAAFALLALSLLGRSTSRVAHAAGLAVAAAIVAVLAVEQRSILPLFTERPLTQEQVALMLLFDVRDEEALAKTHGIPVETLMHQAGILAELQVAPFDWPERRWLGQPLADLFTVTSAPPLAGGIRACNAIAGEPRVVRVNGWTAPHPPGARRRIVLADATGRVCGLGGTGWPHDDATTSRWRGYCVVPEAAAAQVTAYVVSEDGATAHALPETRAMTRAFATLAPVTILTDDVVARPAGVDPAWTAGGQHPSAPPLERAGPVYGSWSGSDANVGKLVFGPFASGPGSRLAIPFLTGPVGRGLSLRLETADGALVLAELRDPDPTPSGWLAWRVEQPATASAAQVVLVAEDQGAGWGQWLAVGLPCRAQ